MNIPVLREFSNTLSLKNNTIRIRCTSCRSSFLLWSTHTNMHPKEDGWIKCFRVHQPNTMLIWKCLKHNERSASYYYYYLLRGWNFWSVLPYVVLSLSIVWFKSFSIFCCCFLFCFVFTFASYQYICFSLFFLYFRWLLTRVGRFCWISRDYKIRNRRTTIR